MSEIVDSINLVIKGLNGNGRDLVFAFGVLLVCYFVFKQTFVALIKKTIDQSDMFVGNITKELKNITEEITKTRESLIKLQESQIRIDEKLKDVDDRLDDVEKQMKVSK